MNPTPPPPVPKPRARYMRNSLGSLDRDETEHLQSGGDSPPPPLMALDRSAVFPTLAGITDIISNSIPSLAGLATSLRGSASSASSAPSAPPSIDSMADSIANYIPSLAGTAGAVANPPAGTFNSASFTTPANTVSLDSIVSSFANIPSLAGIVSNVANPAVSSITTPSAPPPSADPPSLARIGTAHKDVGALSQLVMLTLDTDTGVTLPSLQEAEPTEEVSRRCPHTIKEENPYVTVLACWASQEEADTDSSNEEDDTGTSTAPSGAEGPMEGDPAHNPCSITANLPSNQTGRLVPARLAPPPPPSQSKKPLRQKTPRAATIRVSRKKGASGGAAPQSAVVRAGWLDVWKGFRHNVLWATLDGQLMSLWKKRNDRFSEVRFHVSSITNVKKQDKHRFSVYFRKKHYDFMAHSDEVHEGWVTSLLASRGQPSPAPAEFHGPITMKDTRSRAYTALWGHDLWIYPSKEGFQLGIASFSVPLNVATVKPTGKHSFSLITPYKSFSLSVDSSKDLSVWLDVLSSTIRSALSCSQVALRLWENPDNKVCGDCGAANPEWASVNLLLVVCQACAGQHRALGSNLSKVRSLKMDSKIWTEPLVQLFVAHGNRLANQVWAPAVPAADQLFPGSSDEERSKFIQDKYSRGRYRRVHNLTSFPALMDQRLRQVVCGDDVDETMSLICSGAKVCQTDPLSPSPILLAERANQALQTELLRLNEYTDIPPYTNRNPDPAPSGKIGPVCAGEEEEELHGKLEDDRFLFSLENESAACDVLDLREVLSVFVKDGPALQFEMVTLGDQLICAADNREALMSHLLHILKVILPGGVSYAEVGGASAVSRVRVIEVGGAPVQTDAWLILWEDGVSVHPVHRNTLQPLSVELSAVRNHEMDPSENLVTMITEDRRMALRFEEPHSSRGSVPPAIERCISHITHYGLKVDGVYRRCGLTGKVTRLVEALMTSPSSAPLEADEQGVLDAGSALKQYVRQQQSLIPEAERPQWIHAAVISDERSRFSSYRRLLQKLPDDNRATLNALFGHFYMVQVFSQVNRMSAQNLALVLVPTLFQTLNQDLLTLTREFIIHHTLLFLTPGREEEEEEEEQITVF
ncbi:hypothetical protein PBY51_002270 [Eleginops maclovinus]|uniref:Arf-GAP with Rho-GAP domain, ANK repeat and PH domain-containing protein 1-like n=1 Tax=Eleginops maclovinus TaxID=56733 RepID=A0AAN8AKC2_ELEMC|nr:hypothetical protein PBY51_002270 [Eleginops maclovinus]